MKLLENGRLTAGYQAECAATRELLDRIGDKWSVFAIVLLGDRAMRFNELRRTLHGISQRVLTSTLRGLERDGLVRRTVHPTNPPQVDYALTPLGRTVLEPVKVLALWADAHRADVTRARETYDRAATRRAAS